jgi:hypothetical protein
MPGFEPSLRRGEVLGNHQARPVRVDRASTDETEVTLG